MARMNPDDLRKASHLILDTKHHERWDKLPHVFELKSNGITIDTNPTFSGICKVYKEVHDRNIPVEIFKINNVTGKKTRVAINPLY